MPEAKDLTTVFEEMKTQFQLVPPQVPEEEMSDRQLNAFLEAIAIIFEKCDTKEECVEAITRIQDELTKEA